MKRIRRLCLAALLLLLCLPSGLKGFLATQSAPQAVLDAADQVVTIQTFDYKGDSLGQGSGFLLPGGVMATNAHVLRGAARADVIDFSNTVIASPVFAYYFLGFEGPKELDLAILDVPDTDGGLEIAQAVPQVGDEIWVIGSPQGLTGTLTNGIVSGKRRIDDIVHLQISAPISPGSSGGPVLNSDGLVIGVASGSVAGQNLNFAIPSAYLDILQEHRSKLFTGGFPEGDNLPTVDADNPWRRIGHTRYKGELLEWRIHVNSIKVSFGNVRFSVSVHADDDISSGAGFALALLRYSTNCFEDEQSFGEKFFNAQSDWIDGPADQEWEMVTHGWIDDAIIRLICH